MPFFALLFALPPAAVFTQVAVEPANTTADNDVPVLALTAEAAVENPPEAAAATDVASVETTSIPDDAEVASSRVATTSATSAATAPATLSRHDTIPFYDAWFEFLRDSPRPARADEFVPDIKKIFAEEGLPAELAWLPEIESMFDPRAHNTVGARGLFQIMPGTATELGLELLPFDERTNPEKSARAAAALLRRLHGRFNSWPLALAAYNAGEGRVRRTLKASEASTFGEIAAALPVETQLYVPKVLATLTVREGIAPESLAAPRPLLAN